MHKLACSVATLFKCTTFSLISSQQQKNWFKLMWWRAALILYTISYFELLFGDVSGYESNINGWTVFILKGHLPWPWAGWYDLKCVLTFSWYPYWSWYAKKVIGIILIHSLIHSFKRLISFKVVGNGDYSEASPHGKDQNCPGTNCRANTLTAHTLSHTLWG